MPRFALPCCSAAPLNTQVCQNTPWPFRVEANGCQQCSYNCATAVLSSTSCACHCPKDERPHYAHGDKPDADRDEQPYHSHDDKPDEHKPYAEEGEKEHYTRERDDERKHEDRQYRDDTPGSYKEAHRENRPYGDKPTDSYKEAIHEDMSADAHKDEGPYDEGRDGHKREHDSAEEKRVYEDRPYAGKGHEAVDEAPYARREAQYEDRQYADGHGAGYREGSSGHAESDHDDKPRSEDGPHKAPHDDSADAMPWYERKRPDDGAKGSGYDDKESEKPRRFGPYSDRAPADKTSVDAETAKPDAVVDAVVEGPADKEGAGVDEGRVEGNEGGGSEAVVQTAAMWHPLVSDYGSRYGPYDSSEPRECDSTAEKKCMCGPPALTVVAGCDKITYDPCENILKCSSAGYY